jgi:hypothetical protein
VLMDVDAPGAAVEAVREPPGEPEQDDRWRRVPMFLMLRALKPRT